MALEAYHSNISRSILLKKNFIDFNIIHIKQQQQQQQRFKSHRDRNKVLLTESSNLNLNYSKGKKLITNHSQLFKRENKAKVNEIIDELLFPRIEPHYHIYSSNEKQFNTFDYSNTIDKRKMIMYKILTENPSQYELKSWKNKDLVNKKHRNQRHILKEINEYKALKKYSTISAMPSLIKAKSYSWMIQSIIQNKPQINIIPKQQHY